MINFTGVLNTRKLNLLERHVADTRCELQSITFVLYVYEHILKNDIKYKYIDFVNADFKF